MASNRHHLYFPKKDYKGGIEKSFRNLPCNIVWIDEYAHRLLHRYSSPPTKPSHDSMAEAINRHKNKDCSCYD